MYALYEGFDFARASTIPLLARPIRAPVMGEAAVPDMPRELGWMIVGIYTIIMTAFLLLFSRSAEAAMAILISAVYTAMYLSVPSIFLATESRSGRITWASFLEKGLDTWTGHIEGRPAVVQILLIPTAIALAVMAIGLVYRLSI